MNKAIDSPQTIPDLHDQLLRIGFVVRRIFNEQDHQFRLEYTREFFDADIVVSPWQSAPPVVEQPAGGYCWLTPAEQVDGLSDMALLRATQLEHYPVYLQDKHGRVHLTTFDSFLELELLFKLCRVDLPQPI